MNIKSSFVCNNCAKILEKPIHLPCNCASICSSHVSTLAKLKEPSVTCKECKKEFQIEAHTFKENKQLGSILEMELYLTEREKKLKLELNKMLNDLHEATSEFNLRSTVLSVLSYDHFANVRREVDIKRETSIEKIHQLSDDFIKKIKLAEEEFKKSIDAKASSSLDLNLESEKQHLNECFRNPVLTLDALENLKRESESKLKERQLHLTSFV